MSVASDGDRCCKDDKGCPDNCYGASGPASKRNKFNYFDEGISFTGNGLNDFGPQLSCRFSDFYNNKVSVNLNGVNTVNFGDVRILLEDNKIIFSDSSPPLTYQYSSIFAGYCPAFGIKANNCSGLIFIKTSLNLKQ